MPRRIRKLAYSGLYVIDEQVIPSGKHWASGAYITWPGFYCSKTNAEKALKSIR